MEKVRNILSEKGNAVISVKPDTPMFEAVKLMMDYSSGSALVMDGESLVGILSERDFIRKVYLHQKCSEPILARDIMTAEVLTVTPDHPLEDCMNLMTDNRIRHLPVLENKKVVGVISIGDIVKFLMNHKEFLIKNLENYITGG